MSAYNYIPLSTFEQELANRLYDPTMVYWTQPELLVYIQEALRTWNALTGFWRGDFTFQTVSGTGWYDLTSTSQMPNTLRPLTVTDATLYNNILYRLLEPAQMSPWVGSAQFSADDIVNAVSRKRDEILSICGCTQTVRIVSAIAGRVQLPDSVIDVRRMAYLPESSFGVPNSILWPEDAWAEQSFNRNYTLATAGVPSVYLMTSQPPIAFDVDAPPAYAGNYELLTVEAGPALAVGSPQTLSVPDDWTPLILWGALSDLLNRESNAKDALRAKYCEQRYRMGLRLLENAPALLQMRIGNVPVEVDSIRAADLYQTSWEAQVAGAPSAAYYSGLNLLALAPMPNAGPYSATATVIENAPVPSNPGDPVQVSRDDLDAVIDYAQHLAAFKMGGAEFLATMPLLSRFLKQATVYGLKLAEIAEYTSVLMGLGQRESDMNPRMQPAPTPESAPETVP